MCNKPISQSTTITLDLLPPLATPRQCEAATGVHERTIRRMLNAGTIEGVKVGGLWYVNTSKLAAFLGLA